MKTSRHERAIRAAIEASDERLTELKEQEREATEALNVARTYLGAEQTFRIRLQRLLEAPEGDND